MRTDNTSILRVSILSLGRVHLFRWHGDGSAPTLVKRRRRGEFRRATGGVHRAPPSGRRGEHRLSQAIRFHFPYRLQAHTHALPRAEFRPWRRVVAAAAEHRRHAAFFAERRRVHAPDFLQLQLDSAHRDTPPPCSAGPPEDRPTKRKSIIIRS